MLDHFQQAWNGYMVRHPEIWISFVAICVTCLLERVLMARAEFQPRGAKIAYLRLCGNISLVAIWFCVVSSFTLALSLFLSHYSWVRNGLFHQLDWPSWLKALITFFVMDFFLYATHRMEHKIPLLWKFHSVHHSDSFLDASTTLRKHPISSIFLSVLSAALILSMGFQSEHILIYNVIGSAVVIYSHSGFRTPKLLDCGLRACFIIRPIDHAIHHSDYQPETDSNFGQVFSFWDHLFGTFRMRADLKGFHFGLRHISETRLEKFPRVLLAPFAYVSQN